MKILKPKPLYSTFVFLGIIYEVVSLLAFVDLTIFGILVQIDNDPAWKHTFFIKKVNSSKV
jgi:hypothetical protein